MMIIISSIGTLKKVRTIRIFIGTFPSWLNHNRSSNYSCVMVGNGTTENFQTLTENINTIVFEEIGMDTFFDLRPWRRLSELEQ